MGSPDEQRTPKSKGSVSDVSGDKRQSLYPEVGV